MGTNHVGVGACSTPNLAQKWENGKNYSYMEKFVIRIPKQGLFQDSNSGDVGWIYGGLVVSPKIEFSPLQVGGMWSTGSCICNMRIYMYWYMAWQSKSHTPFWPFPDLSEDKRSRRDVIPPWEAIDEIRSKLGQRLTSMGQVAPPQPTSRTKTGRRRTFDSGNSSTDRR